LCIRSGENGRDKEMGHRHASQGKKRKDCCKRAAPRSRSHEPAAETGNAVPMREFS
jgi:hypothetical protein